jgi:cytochrome c2
MPGRDDENRGWAVFFWLLAAGGVGTALLVAVGVGLLVGHFAIGATSTKTVTVRAGGTATTATTTSTSSSATSTSPSTTSTSSSRTASTTSSTSSAATTPTPSADVASGRKLYTADTCSACHTLNGSTSVGPSWKGLYGSRVTLTTGRTVVADAAYLTKHIVDPNAMTVKGFPADVMASAISSFDLSSKPKDVAALVAFIRSLK